jgi:hypothetical protein
MLTLATPPHPLQPCALPPLSTSLACARMALLFCVRPSGIWAVGVPTSSTGCALVLTIAPDTGTAHAYPLPVGRVEALAGGAAGEAYLGAADGTVWRLLPETGDVQRVAALPARVVGGTTGPDGLPCLALADGRLVTIQLDGTHSYWPQCLPASAGYHVVTAAGALWAFPRSPGPAAYRLDPSTQEVAPVSIAGLQAEEGIVQVVPSTTGTLVAVTSPRGDLVRLAGTTLACLARWSGLPGAEVIYSLCDIEGQVLASGEDSGTLYHWVEDNWERLGTPMPADPHTVCALPDRSLLGVTASGRLMRCGPDWQRYALSSLPLRREAGMAVSALAVGPDRCLYVATGENLRLACWDVTREIWHHIGTVAPACGAVSALGIAGERVLLGVDPPGRLLGYYPDLAYRLLDNPRPLGLLPEGARELLTPMVHHATDVYLAARTSTRAEGVLIRLDPIEDELVGFASILPRRAFTSLVVDRLNDWLVLGSVAGAGLPAEVACWAPGMAQTVRHAALFPLADRVVVWAAESGCLYLTDGGTEFVVWMPATDEVVARGSFSLGAITSLITSHQGRLYGLAGGRFFRWEPREGRLVILADAVGTCLTEIRHDVFAYTHAGSIFTIDVSPAGSRQST